MPYLFRPTLGSELALSRCEYKRVKAGLCELRNIDPLRAMRVMVSLGGFRRVKGNWPFQSFASDGEFGRVKGNWPLLLW